MPPAPDPVAETPGGSRRMGIAPATRVPLAGRGINDLPRDALLRVLSYLGARQLVRTCVLSRQWRDLWRDVPRIKASREEFGPDADGGYEERNPLFKKFVNHLLMLRNPVALDEFRLYHYIGSQHQADSAEANLWIGHALLCNARSVEVAVWGYGLKIDSAVFTSQHLTTLMLCACNLTPGFFEHLQTGCKVLECLILQHCAIDDIEISSHTLKILFISTDSFFRSDDRASISIPSLKYLGFYGHAHGRIPLLENMESLVLAYVSVGRFEGTGIQVDVISQFLWGLSGITELDFNFVETELNMEKNLQWCPTFNNLKFLTLGEWCLHADFYALIVFLQNSPNLVNLTLNLKKPIDVPGRFRGELRERSFTCEQLKIVKIICSERNPVVDSLEKFLVASGITSGQIRISH
ncbi:FBD-associated F-box protein At1g66310-like [Phragmites australis]|uniref:FBD-associated F-box protein At1g66310-like n=1 Tax=Phragmites australis TaxID=29695 RepID=UPI002D790EEC|nr:FBD-associated F-box protein At1g66310-like [Phragmites australis]